MKNNLDTLALSITLTLALAAGGFSQGADTARVPVVVDVDAFVSILPPDGLNGTGVTGVNMKANVRDTLVLTVAAGGFTSVLGGSQRQNSAAAAVRHHQGNVSIKLPMRQYASAEAALYTVGGKRVLRGKAAASAGAFSMSRHNVAAGVYLLSVRGSTGGSFTAKLTHHGGRLNINASFDGGVLPSLPKSAAADAWTVTATASGFDGWSQTFNPVKGINPLVQITFNNIKDKGDFSDTTSGGTVFDMVFVQGGTFTMGCTPGQGSSCNSDERPAHDVTLSDFYIGKHEVTQGLWFDVMGETIHELAAKIDGRAAEGEGDNYPVYYVTWFEAQEFITKLSGATGKTYRLPTEAEWEFAARGGNPGKGHDYAYSGSSAAGDVAWCLPGSNNRAHPVGTKAANDLGIHDMSGNVYEWTNDWYGSAYYGASPAVDPKGPQTGTHRVYRGGSYRYDASNVRVALRVRNNTPDMRGTVGFRLALSSD